MVTHSPHAIEQAVGLEYYSSDTDGIGGTLRVDPADFRVREREAVDVEPLDADPGAYPHVVFRATLTNHETNAFAAALSDRLGISRERVRWAGTKDKRAVTTQLFSVDRVEPEQLAGIELPDVDLELLGRAGRAVALGDLRGNDFTITLRDPASDEVADRVAAITDELRAFGGNERVGVPNYFGQQRFGSHRPVTHRVGLAILRGDWEAAVRTYVADRAETEPAATYQARGVAGERFDAGDWQGTLEALPERLGYERALMHALIEGADYRGAIETLPSTLQRLFIHAAQSYVFNRILSARLKRGLPFHRPVAGDVVCFADDGTPATPDPSRVQRVTDRRVETIGRHCDRDRAFVTAPLVGTETDLAEGDPGAIERAVLADLNIDPADFDLPDEWASSGTRRAILVRTELETRVDPEAVTFDFTLPSGAYATVLLREYRKRPTR